MPLEKRPLPRLALEKVRCQSHLAAGIEGVLPVALSSARGSGRGEERRRTAMARQQTRRRKVQDSHGQAADGLLAARTHPMVMSTPILLHKRLKGRLPTVVRGAR